MTINGAGVSPEQKHAHVAGILSRRGAASDYKV